jgi:glycosyltransferase involved in cell wall biosynthesis
MKKVISVLHVIEKLNDEEGGLYNVVKHLCKFLPNVNNLILTSEIKKKSIVKNFNCGIFKSNSLLNCYKILSDSKIDLIHIHGIWSPLNTMAALLALKKKISYIVSPQGMLEPWSIQQKSLKKRISLFFFWKHILKKASRVLFTSKKEYLNFKKIDLTRNIAYSIIPNGFYIYSKIKKKTFVKKKNLLFLSRIHKKKGINELIDAFKEINPKNWNLNIAGSGDLYFVELLKKKCGINFLNKKIFFLGFQDEIQKIKTFNSNNVFVLPSYSENFGIVIAEALGCGLPVVTTKATPWSLIQKNNCGWWINTGKTSLKKCLQNVFETNNFKLNQMSVNSKKLSDNYRWEKVSRKIRILYSEIID